MILWAVMVEKSKDPRRILAWRGCDVSEGPSTQYLETPKGVYTLDPQCTSIQGLMVSISWYMGYLKG